MISAGNVDRPQIDEMLSSSGFFMFEEGRVADSDGKHEMIRKGYANTTG
jgi:Icc-related predicted phosphoesterase